MPRFVILRHECPADRPRRSHWDLMFEADGRLWTWALRDSPDSPSQPAERLADHRIDFLEFEGAIPGDRGSVVRWDRGTYEIEGSRRTLSECIEVVLRGERLRGRMVLEAVAESSPRSRDEMEGAKSDAYCWRVEFNSV